MVNIQSKEVLARLLATENLTVVHQNVKTASFNVKDRILTLPLWDEMENYTYDHLVGHEVAHALYTPADEWEKQAKAGGSGFQSFMNVVEDARIEKLIQRRYPGLRKSFIQSYKKLLADGFFGKSADEINSFKLIDRLNVLFKCGQTVGVQFSKEEKSWIAEIENAETFEQVVDIATRLYGKAKEEFEDEQQAMSQAFAEMQEEFGDEEDSDNGEYDFGFEGESEFDTESDGGSEEETDTESSEKADTTETSDVEDTSTEKGNTEPSESDTEGFESTTVGHEGGEEGPQSITDKSLSDNISKEFASDPNKKFYNLKLPTDKPKLTLDRVVDYKEILSLFDDNPAAIEYGNEQLKTFQRDNKKTINYLVKEFEMKKKATEYKRATTSKTGIIDTLKMNNYKFSDDIFKKMTILPEGKNHGLLMFIDWSGSMVDQLKHTIDQLLNLVMFCKQVNIPFEVYAFSDRYYRTVRSEDKQFKHREIFDMYEIGYDDNFRMLQMFTNKMSRSDYQKMLKVMLSIAGWMEDYNARLRYTVPYSLYLGGTPLDDTIISAMTLHKIFKEKNRLDIVNTVFLTDGASASMKFNEEYTDHFTKEILPSTQRLSFRSAYVSSSIVCYVTDPVTKKRYRWINEQQATPQLLKMFREHTQSNVIGFHILPFRKPSAIREIPSGDYSEREELWETLKKDKFCIIPNYGYNQYFGILGGKALATSNGEIEVSDDASKGKIRQAFKKANSNRKGSRIMLSKFIDMVA